MNKYKKLAYKMALKIQKDNPVTDAKKNLSKKVEKAKEAYKESEKTGFVGRIKNWWNARVAKNKAKGEGMKESKDSNESKDLKDPKDLKDSKEVKEEQADKKEKLIEIQATAPEQAEVEINLMKLAGKDLKKLSPEEKKRLLADEKKFQEGISTIKDLIAPSSMEVSSTKMRLGDVYVRSFYVYSYPRFLETNWLTPIINFDVTMDIAMYVYPYESAAIMKKLRRKVAQFRSSIRMDREKGVVEDPGLETALEDAESLRRDLQRGTERFFQYALYFTIYSEDEKKLDKFSKQLESLLGGKLVMTKRADMQIDHGFTASLPLALDELEMMNNMNTSPLSTTFPFTSSELTSNTGILYGLNRHNDSLIIFDRFEMENANSVVFAKSGAGKSYAVKLEILRSLMMGTDVMVIDPENEYKELCQEVGGTYVNVSLSSEERINPFDLPLKAEDQIDKPGDRLREHVINLTGLVQLMLGKITDEEAGLLDQALIQTYESKGITMDTEEPEKMVPPLMRDLVEIMSGIKGAENMSNRLMKFVEGTFSGIFNQPTNVNLGAGMIVFSIRDLEDQLRPLASYVILNYIWNKVRSKLKRRLLIIDEAWIMMQHEDSAKFLYGLAKRARKYYLGVTTITQDVEDFVTSPYGKPIITNSSIQLLLKQSPAAIEYLQKIFNLTDGEKYLLLNSGVGQGLFFAGNKHVAIQIIASYGEDKIVTTNPEEILKGRTDEEPVEASEPV
jgi:conjugal transfer ATP-binding protein TraC